MHVIIKGLDARKPCLRGFRLSENQHVTSLHGLHVAIMEGSSSSNYSGLGRLDGLLYPTYLKRLRFVGHILHWLAVPFRARKAPVGCTLRGWEGSSSLHTSKL